MDADGGNLAEKVFGALSEIDGSARRQSISAKKPNFVLGIFNLVSHLCLKVRTVLIPLNETGVF